MHTLVVRVRLLAPILSTRTLGWYLITSRILLLILLVRARTRVSDRPLL